MAHNKKDKLQPIPDMDRPIRYEALQKMKKQKEESEMDEGMDEGVENYKTIQTEACNSLLVVVL
jgi:hypothetical protein